MLPEDEEGLKELLIMYGPKTVMRRLSVLASEAADEASDFDLKEQAKELSQMAQALEDITSGRPFLV